MDAHDQLFRNYLHAVFDALHKKAVEYCSEGDPATQAERLGEIIAAYRDFSTKSHAFGIASSTLDDGTCVGCPGGRCVGGLCLGADIGASTADLIEAGVPVPVSSKANA